MAIKKTTKTKPGTDAVNSVGPLGGLAAGVIAGVNMSPTTPAPAPNSAITMPPAMTAAFTPRPTTPTTSSVASVGPLGGLQAGVIAGVKVGMGNTSSTGTGTGGSSNTTPKDISPETRDAFEELAMTLKGWNLEELAATYTQLMVEGKTAAQALTILKYSKEINPSTGLPYNAEYTKRFAGNAARIAGGMNAYDERTYIAVENAYEETLRLNGLGNMISTDRAVNQAKYADYMAKGIAPTEFENRIELVSERVMNMDPNTKAQFKAYYPQLTDTDLVSYFLNPKETLPVLKNKVTAAEIGAVAGAAKYGIGEARAMDLAQFGVTRATALTGYQDIAEAVPTGTKLSNIYAEENIQYGQTEAEDDFLKQDAQAKLKRNRLASKERATFDASSGNAPGAYSTSYLKRSSAAGQI
jgi:hypothetical protein